MEAEGVEAGALEGAGFWEVVSTRFFAEAVEGVEEIFAVQLCEVVWRC